MRGSQSSGRQLAKIAQAIFPTNQRKPKTDLDALALVFPRLATVACISSFDWFIVWCVLCDQLD